MLNKSSVYLNYGVVIFFFLVWLQFWGNVHKTGTLEINRKKNWLVNRMYISDNIDEHVSKNKFLSEIRQCCFSIFRLLKLPFMTNYTVKAMIYLIINKCETERLKWMFSCSIFSKNKRYIFWKYNWVYESENEIFQIEK